MASDHEVIIGESQLRAEIERAQVDRWSGEQAGAWHRSRGWLIGCNFIPSTATNQLEMWQASTFDLQTINRELGWAAGLGFNAIRVFLHDLVWIDDRTEFIDRMMRFLDVAWAHDLSTMFVFFDDCWRPDPRLGMQPAPVPGRHNSGWAQSPGATAKADPAEWARLEEYVRGVIGRFRDDACVLAWDIYNEPGNTGYGERSLPLLEAAFRWARAARPVQPLTSAPWTEWESRGLWATVPSVREFQLAASDLVTFHSYARPEVVEWVISELEDCERPILCTEYLARPLGSRFETLLPLFQRRHVGCFNWGFVAGRTQTSLPWVREPALHQDVWFSDILSADGSPADPAEIALIRSYAARERGGTDGSPL